jgi:hypothetical protein
MNTSGTRRAAIMCATLFVAPGLAAAAQGEVGPSAGLEWLQRINKASIVVEPSSAGRSRLVARWTDDERKLLMEGEDLRLSTTSAGVRIESKGLVTIRWRNRTVGYWEVEEMDLKIAKGSQATMSAKRIAAFR